jgi:hypothetical protein
MTPVEGVYEMIDSPERDEDEILLLKTDQSASKRQPKVEALAVLQSTSLTVLVRPSEKVRGTS